MHVEKKLYGQCIHVESDRGEGPCQRLRVVVSALCLLEVLQEEAFGSLVIMESG